jgi:phosphoserine phosphatase RsbU/P
MTEQRDRYDRFADLFAQQMRRAADQVRWASMRSGVRPGSAYDEYLKSVQELFTRGVTPQGLRELVEHETRDTYRFFTREVEVQDLASLPWFKRYPAIVWRVFEAMAYRLNPARRILFAIAVPLLMLAWWIYLIHVAAAGAWTTSFFTFEGMVVGAGTLLFFLLLLELKDKLGLKGDLEVARQIQFGLLPFEPWEHGGTTIVTAMRPANTVGGDYFDIVALGQERVAIVMADVAGKGMPAALLMALLQGSLRTLLTAGLRGSELMVKLNAHLCANIPSNRLITLFYGELALDTGALVYVNAGHNPPLLVRHLGQIESLPATAMALGVLSDTPFATAETALSPGDRLLLYTDGVTEAEGPQDQEYGEERVRTFLAGHRADPPRAVIDGLLANVLLHCGPVRPRDDMTLMSVSMG